MTSASTHDSQVAIPLGTLTAGRVENLYDLMDAAYDSIEIWAHSILLGHKPIIDVNPRRSVEMQEALKQEKKARRTLGLVFPEERRYVVRSGSERINGRLKDEFGGRHVRVRGYDKVLAHLMFGMTVLTASQLDAHFLFHVGLGWLVGWRVADPRVPLYHRLPSVTPRATRWSYGDSARILAHPGPCRTPRK